MPDGEYIYSFRYVEPEGSADVSHSGEATASLLRFKKGTGASGDTSKQLPSDRNIITAAALQDPLIRNAVSRFNSRDSEYYIDLKVYLAGYDGAESLENALTAFNMDLIAGKIPDIIFIDSTTPYQSYISKGLFVDLYEFMDNDPDMSREDYLPNILKLLETDGKLYRAAASFQINTVIGKKSDVGEGTGWTWEEYNALLARKPKGIAPIADEYMPVSRETYLNYALMTKIEEYIDFNAGKCRFNEPDFIGLLESVNDYPGGAERRVNKADFRSGDPLLMNIWLGNLFYDTVWRYETEYLGEEVTYIGYPTADGGNKGSACWFTNSFALSSKAAEPEGAWQFVKFLLTDYQETAGGTGFGGLPGFPLKTSVLERWAEEEKDPSKYEDTTRYYMIDEVKVAVRPPKDEDIQKIVDLIYSLETSAFYDAKILDIISEEAAPYFAGQKTAEAVAAIIQDRAGLYLAETS
jgi:ABC-type glycerol-3-phosphate transport system substrate-binding protein